MPVCSNCSIEYAEGEGFCSKCGARLFLVQEDRSCSLEEARQCVVQVYAAAALW